MAFTNINDYSIDEAFTAEDWNKFVANTQYNRTQFQVHHADASGTHNLNQGIEVVSNELGIKNHNGIYITSTGLDFSSIAFDAYVLSGAADSAPRGLFGSVKSAIDSGCTRIFVGPGTFTETAKEKDVEVLVGSGIGRTQVTWSDGSTQDYGIQVSGLLANIGFSYISNLSSNVSAAVVLESRAVAVNSYIFSNYQNAVYMEDANTAMYNCYIKNTNNMGIRNNSGLVTGCYIWAEVGFYSSCGRALGNTLYVDIIADLTAGTNVFAGNACALTGTGGIILDTNDCQIIGNGIIKVSGAATTNLIQVIDDNCIIAGNTIDGLSTATNGINVTATADRTIVGPGNIIQNCTNNYVNSGTNTQEGANITT